LVANSWSWLTDGHCSVRAPTDHSRQGPIVARKTISSFLWTEGLYSKQEVDSQTLL
jgi:hypothetical protein